MTELNLDLLKKVLDKIVSDPDDHNQLHWMVKTGSTSPVREVTGGVALSCPTTACVAGWACALAGDDPFIGDGSMHYYRDRSDGFIYVEEVVTPEGEVHYIDDRAEALLGLEARVAHDLFDACNTRGYVTNRLSELIKEAERKLL